MQIPDGLTDLWNVARPYITHVVTIILSALVTYIFTERHFRRKKWHEFNQRRLDEFYGPMLGLIKQVIANAETNVKTSDASNQAWRKICERNLQPFEDHNKYFEPFRRSLDYENERFRKEDIPAFDKMLEIFKSKIHLAYPSTKALFSQFSQYADHWHRTLPPEAWEGMNITGEPLAKLAVDVEAHVDRLRRELSGEKRL